MQPLDRVFWSLVGGGLLLAVVVTSGAVWLTARVQWQDAEMRVARAEAGRQAAIVERVLADHRRRLARLAADPDILAILRGAPESAARTVQPVEEFLALRLFDRAGTPLWRLSPPDRADTPLAPEAWEALVDRLTAARRAGATHLARSDGAGRHDLLIAVAAGDGAGVLVGRAALDLATLFPGAPPRLVAAEAAAPGAAAIPGSALAVAPVDAEGLPGVPPPVIGAVGVALALCFGVIGLVSRTVVLRPYRELQHAQAVLLARQKCLGELAAIALMVEEGIVTTDLEGRIRWVNPAFERRSGYSLTDIAGRTAPEILHCPGTDPETERQLAEAMTERRPVHCEMLCRGADGTTGWHMVSMSPLFDDAGMAYGFATIGRDITEERAQRDALEAARNEIAHQALHDDLTGLANRRALTSELTRRIAAGETEVTVIRMDLDHFKFVNDTMGHETGDLVLTEVARILSEETKADDLAVRMGGDEFVILMRAGGGISDGEIVAERLLHRIRRPMHIGDKTIRVGASFGIAGTQTGVVDVDTLLLAADAALYRAKEAGRNAVRTYTAAIHAEVVETRVLAEEIKRGIERREFVPVYQAQVEADTHCISGVETLVRWHHPERGLLAPGVFMPVAKHLSLLSQIDEMVMERALQDMLALDERGCPIPKISFNVTAPRLNDPATLATLSRFPLKNTQVAFEILESVLLDDMGESFDHYLDILRGSGIAIEIDDFGSGHASMISLMRAQPDALKIDQRLILPLTESDTYRELVSAILGIARALDIKVTAEGVETAEHARILCELGCDVLQGYFFSTPMTFDDLFGFTVTDARRIVPDI